MKRTVASVLIVALALTLLLPASALAKRGGVPAGGNGKGAAPAHQDDAGKDRGGPAIEAEESRPVPPSQVKRQQQASREASTAAGGDAPMAAEETSVSPGPRRTGIANALSRLQRNLERMQADLDAGTRGSLPTGLQSVIAKFMAWLGIEAGDPGMTPDDDGSVELMGTVEPTGTVVPTGTVEADIVGGDPGE